MKYNKEIKNNTAYKSCAKYGEKLALEIVSTFTNLIGKKVFLADGSLSKLSKSFINPIIQKHSGNKMDRLHRCSLRENGYGMGANLNIAYYHTFGIGANGLSDGDYYEFSIYKFLNTDNDGKLISVMDNDEIKEYFKYYKRFTDKQLIKLLEKRDRLYAEYNKVVSELPHFIR